MSEARRFNEGKPKLGYFARSFPKMLETVARIKEFGAVKYDEGNWRKGNKPDAEYLDSAARHLAKFLEGEAHDKDSGCHHLGHMVWNLCALLELNYPDTPAIDEETFREQMEYWAAKKAEENSPSEADIDPMVDPEHRKAQGLPPLEGKLKMEVNGETVAERVVPINTEGTNTELDVDFGLLPLEDSLFIGGAKKFDRDGYYIEGNWVAEPECLIDWDADETRPYTGLFMGGSKVSSEPKFNPDCVAKAREELAELRNRQAQDRLDAQRYANVALAIINARFDGSGFYVGGEKIADPTDLMVPPGETEREFAIESNGILNNIFIGANIGPDSIKFNLSDPMPDAPTIDEILSNPAEGADLFAGGEPPKIVKEEPIQFLTLDVPRNKVFEKFADKYSDQLMDNADSSLNEWRM